MAKKKSAFSSVKTPLVKAAPFVSDYYLWSKVAKSISPLKGKKLPIDISKNNELGEVLRQQIPPLSAPSYSPSISSSKNIGLNIEPKMMRRLIRGKMPIDATLDLHDLKQDEAHAILVRFLQIAYARNNRNVLVITGKGKDKKKTHDYEFAINYQYGVLRNMLPIWLGGASLRQIVSGHEQAGAAHGGSGAFYVRLKKQK